MDEDLDTRHVAPIVDRAMILLSLVVASSLIVFEGGVGWEKSTTVRTTIGALAALSTLGYGMLLLVKTRGRTVRAVKSAVTVVSGFLVLVVAVASTLVLLGEPSGRHYAVVRAGSGLVASLLAPGYLLLVSSGVRRRTSRPLLYAVAVSSGFLVSLGLAANFVLREIGVQRPIDSVPVLLSLSLVVLAVPAYHRTVSGYHRTVHASHRTVHANRRTVTTGPRRSQSVSLRPLLAVAFLVLLPLLAVAAAGAMNAHGNNRPMLILIGLLASTVLLLVTEVIPPGLRPFAIWSVAVSVLLQMTLISPHLWGWDIHYEYHAAHTIHQQGFWHPRTSSLLSITFLAAVYSVVTGLDIVTIYKLVYPFIAALLPVAIYYLGDLEFDDERIAVLAPFCLVFYYGYFKDMPHKQVVAQLFLALLLLTLLDDELTGVRRRVLGVTFGGMMILSHYGVSLLFVAFYTAAIVTVLLARRTGILSSTDSSAVRPTFVVLLGVMWISWYMFTASGAVFENVVLLGYQHVVSMTGVTARSGAGYATKQFESALWVVYKLLYVAVIGLISLGLARALYSIAPGRSTVVEHAEYVVFSSFAFAFLLSSVVVTYSMGFDRTILLTLVVLAPFTLVGLRVPFAILRKASRQAIPAPPTGTTAALFAVFLAVMYVFSSGAAFAVAGEQVPAYSINLEEETSWQVYEQSEVEATRWLAATSPANSTVAVYNRWTALKSRDGLLVYEVIDRERIVSIWPSRTELEGTPYIYISHKPMSSTADSERQYIDPRRTAFYPRHVVTANKVYSSGSAHIYKARASEELGEQAAYATTNATD